MGTTRLDPYCENTARRIKSYDCVHLYVEHCESAEHTVLVRPYSTRESSTRTLVVSVQVELSEVSPAAARGLSTVAPFFLVLRWGAFG